MQQLTWSDSFSVGHAGLDEEHRSIIAAINSLKTNETDAEQQRHLLKRLVTTASKHFEHESSLLRTILSNVDAEQLEIRSMSREATVEHLREHEQSLSLLNRVVVEASSGYLSAPRELYENLVHWFVQHAVKHDAELKAVFQAIEKDCPALHRMLA